MNNALKKISRRAKELQKSHPKTPWVSLIKQASREYRTGKMGAKKKDTKRQTGSSNKHYDQLRTARPPGARKPAGGKKVTYYERRKNRSDKPGSLTGTPLQRAKNSYAKALLDYALADTIRDTKEAQKRKVKWRKVVRSLQ